MAGNRQSLDDFGTHGLQSARVRDVMRLYMKCPRTRLFFAQLKASTAFETLSK